MGRGDDELEAVAELFNEFFRSMIATTTTAARAMITSTPPAIILRDWSSVPRRGSSSTITGVITGEVVSCGTTCVEGST